MSEAHRLLRRARVFGPPLLDPALLRDGATPVNREALVSLEDDGQARGIHFFAVNASIRSQFEFMRQSLRGPANPSVGVAKISRLVSTGAHPRPARGWG